MAKSVSIFLIVCTLMLISQTCDELAPRPGSAVQESASAFVEAPADRDAPGDDCSPFCICSCRQVPVHGHETALFAASAADDKQFAPEFDFHGADESKTRQPFWQPPKA